MPTVTAGCDDESNDDEEETAQEKARQAAIASVVIDSAQVLQNASAQSGLVRGEGGRSRSASRKRSGAQDDRAASCSLEHYQIRGQELLHRLLDKTFGANLSDDTIAPSETEVQQLPGPDEAPGIRLFRRAPPGISVRAKPEEGAKRRKAKTRVNKDDESPEQHDHRLRAVAVDSERILEQAEKARAKAKAAGEAAEAAAKLAAEREDERIARLKAVRGEEWLPSLRTQGFPDEKSGQAIGRAGRPKM